MGESIETGDFSREKKRDQLAFVGGEIARDRKKRRENVWEGNQSEKDLRLRVHEVSSKLHSYHAHLTEHFIDVILILLAKIRKF